MGKKIKFPLEMKDGYKVRTMEELQKHADVESIIKYFFNGKLKNWLKDRYYEDEMNEIEKIDKSDSRLLEQIYVILKINHEVDTSSIYHVKKIIRHQEKISQIKKHTDDEEILRNIDYVVTNQNEFESAIFSERGIVYLLGKKFILPVDIKNKKLIGIDNPEIVVNSNEIINFNDRNIKFENCHWDNSYKLLLDKYKKIKCVYKSSNLFNDLLNYDDKNKSSQIFNKIKNEFQNFEFSIEKQMINFEEFITELWNKFGYYKSNKLHTNKNILEFLFSDISQNEYSQIILDKSFKTSKKVNKSYFYLGKCWYEFDGKNINKLIEGCKNCNTCWGEMSCNLSYQLIFFSLILVAVNNVVYNNKVNTISDMAYIIGFNIDMIEDWIYVVKNILILEEINLNKLKTKEAKQFFEVLV